MLTDTLRLPSLVVLALSSACGPVEDGAGEEPDLGCELLSGLDSKQCAAVRALELPDAPAPARGNAFADDEGAASLGLQVFFDARFSANQDVRCASCHEPERFFHDGDATSEGGLEVVHRNSPTTLNAAGQRWSFWDGRADSLWSQPLLAFESNAEMGVSRLEVAHLVARNYREAYEEVFGPLPPLGDEGRFPPAGKPGDAAYDAMSEEDRFDVDRVFADVGKALEAYMRRSRTGRARLDDFLAGDDDALSDVEREGLRVFASAGCITCHSGPRLSDERFYDLGVPAADGVVDEGRAAGARLLADSAFALFGPHADGAPADAVSRAELLEEAADPASQNAFLTPSLRNVQRTAPYGHNGSFATLEEVVDHHLAGGGPAAGAGLDPPGPVALSDEERDALLAFLRALDGALPPPPWADWPDR